MHIQCLKIIQLTAFAYVCEAMGRGSRFLRDPKGGKSLGLRGGVTFFKGSKRGGQKNPVNRNENLQTPPPHKK